MSNVLKQHDNDPNFPFVILEKIKDFLGGSQCYLSTGLPLPVDSIALISISNDSKR